MLAVQPAGERHRQQGRQSEAAGGPSWQRRSSGRASGQRGQASALEELQRRKRDVRQCSHGSQQRAVEERAVGVKAVHVKVQVPRVVPLRMHRSNA